MKNQFFKTSLLLSAIVWMTACSSNKDKVKSEMEYHVTTKEVAKSSLADSIFASGNVVPKHVVPIGFMVAGKINSLSFSEGQSVQKGQAMGQLDPINYAVAKEVADAQAKQVEDEYERLTKLYDKSGLSESDYVKIQQGYSQAKSQQKLHNNNLNETRLVAPISGTVISKLKEQGEIIAAGHPIAVISEIKKVYVNTYIPENEIADIKINQAAKVYIPALGKHVDGFVQEMGWVAEAKTRMFTVKIEIDNADLLVRPGMIANIKLAKSAKETKITVPTDAILRENGNSYYVYVVDKAKNRAYKRKVIIEQAGSAKCVISSGIDVNDVIVVEGQQKLVDGALLAK